MTTSATPVSEDRFDLGEGPLWLADGRLTWVDVLEGTVLVGALRDGAVEIVRRYDTGLHVAAALPLAEPDAGWLLAAGSGFAHLAPDGALRVLAEPEADRRGVVRMNDAKCDPAGRLWAGSMAYDERPGAGSLFRVDLDGSVTRVLSDRQISNGLGWSPDGRTIYYSDSGHGVVYHGPYDVDRGEIGPLKPLVEVSGDDGVPDGLCVDAEGSLWVGFWGGAAVRRYDAGGRQIGEIATGAPQTTSCCFGGPDGGTLFITSAAIEMTPEQRAEAPNSGALLAAAPGVSGPPATPFRGALPEG